MKICSICNIEKPISKEYFHIDKCSKDGFRNQCKKCRNKQIQNDRFKDFYKYKINSCKKIDKRKNIYNEETIIDKDYCIFLENKQNNKCYYCEIEMTKNPNFTDITGNKKNISIERLDNNLAHINENCVLCCWNCNNIRKDNYTSEEFQFLMKCLKKKDKIKEFLIKIKNN